jgi:hypothetical protein
LNAIECVIYFLRILADFTVVKGHLHIFPP